jgi:predicted O-linked N-acetylglucosamine transferase (SPINDLY family)
VETPEQYLQMAVHQAGTLKHLAQLRGELRERTRTNLCDAPRFTRGLEEAYRSMWRRWCSQR